MALRIPQPFADPFSGLSRGIESGVGIGLSLRRQRQTEDAAEFAQLQDQLETKKVDKERQTSLLEKQYTFHVINNDMERAQAALQKLDTLNKTDFAQRVPMGSHKAFNKDMASIDKADPDIREAVATDLMTKWPLITPQGIVAQPKEKLPELFAKADVSKFTPESVAIAERTRNRGDLVPIEAGEDREILRDVKGQARFIDTKERVFPGIEKDVKDGVGGMSGAASVKWDKDAGTRLDKIYGTQTEDGFVIDSARMSEYLNANTHLEDYKQKGLSTNEAAVLAARRAKAGGVDPIQEVIDQQRELGKSDAEIRQLLGKSQFKSVNPRAYGLK
ncbi:MAG: hypothetical protein V3U75_01335 [Methylococcaceae bacterium]